MLSRHKSGKRTIVFAPVSGATPMPQVKPWERFYSSENGPYIILATSLVKIPQESLNPCEGYPWVSCVEMSWGDFGTDPVGMRVRIVGD